MNRINLVILVLTVFTGLVYAQDETYAEFKITIDPHKESTKQNLEPKKIAQKICSNISNIQFKSCKQLKTEIVQKENIREKVVLYSSKDYWQADDIKKSMKELGFNTVFMEAYYNGKRVSFADVMSGKYKSSLYKEDVITFKVQIDLKKEMELKSIDKAQLKTDFCKTLSNCYLKLGLREQDAIFNCAAIAYQIKNGGSIGTYSFTNGNIGHEKTDQIKNYLIENGYSTTIVIAFKNGKIVPLSEVKGQE